MVILQNFVLVEQCVSNLEANGIIVPDTVEKKEDLPKGVVVSIGPGTKDDPIDDIKVGDIVHFNKYGVCSTIYENEKKLLIIRHYDLLAVEY